MTPTTRNGTMNRVSVGNAGLDNILFDGLIPHRLYLVEGNPGSGKTTLSLQFLLEGVRAGNRCLYITLSETKEELIAGARSHGWSLNGMDIVELVTDQSVLDGDTQMTMYLPSEVELAETTKQVLEAVVRLNPQRVVFDSLAEMRLLARDPLRYRRQILALKQFFVGRNCTVLLLDDKTGTSTDLQLQSIAHGVITLEQFTPSYGTARRQIQVLKHRGADFRSGFHDYVIREGGLQVFPRLIAAEHSQPFHLEPIQSGVGELDALLGGGPDRGTSTLLIGPAGCGKSTVAVQFAIAAANRGEHAAVFAFDESLTTLKARMNGLGIAFQVGTAPGEVEIRQIDPAEVSPGEFAHLVRHAVEMHDARIVVIDSLNGYLHAMPNEKFLTGQLHELLAYLGRRGVTTLMVVAQHGIVGTSMQTPVDTSYLADSVVLFRYFEYGGKVKKAVSVVKKRSGTHEESIRELRFGAAGISLSEPLSQFHGILSGIPLPVSRQEPSEKLNGENLS